MMITLTLEEEQFILARRNDCQSAKSYVRGLAAASQLARSWAAQCCGGSGEGGIGYKNLADAIDRLPLPDHLRDL